MIIPQVETTPVKGKTEFLTSSFGWREQSNARTLAKWNCEFLNFHEVVAGLEVASRILLCLPWRGFLVEK